MGRTSDRYPVYRNKLTANDERFRALTMATSDVIYCVSADWEVMYELDGRGFLPDAERPITGWKQINIYKEDLEVVDVAIAESIKNKTIFALEHRVNRADGSIGWTFSRAVPILDKDGEIIEWFGTASDISARKEAELALKESRERSDQRRRTYETITSGTPDLMYVFDLNYRFTYANRALLEMWGKSPEDAIGKGLLENGYEPWHAEMHQKEIDQVVATGKSIRGEVSFPHAILGKRIYDYIFTPVFDADGNVEAVAGTTRDITDRKNEEMRKNDFIAMVSHELKTPLTSMKGYVQVLLSRLKSEGDEANINIIQKANTQVEKMIRMINDFLNLSRLESGKIGIKPELFDLASLVKEIQEECSATISTHQIIFAPVESTIINADHDKIGQVIQNLISNAVKYSPAGSTIHVACTNDGGNAYLTVRDHGIGIRTQDLTRVFDRYYRIEDSNGPSISGFGIGLYLCKEIISRHQGKIWAASEADNGSSFSFSLPLYEKIKK